MQGILKSMTQYEEDIKHFMPSLKVRVGLDLTNFVRIDPKTRVIQRGIKKLCKDQQITSPCQYM